MMGRVLHVLSQRPALTGSGITLDALVREAARAGWYQAAIVGTPSSDPRPPVGDLPDDRIHPLLFESSGLGFSIPGMSDVMPYPSRRFSSLTADQLSAYREAWSEHLERVVARERPDFVHVHHAWIVASLVKEAAPGIPVVTHCHATGLRQMVLCRELGETVRDGLRRNELFCALHEADAGRLVEALELAQERVRVVGAGYREDIFRGPTAGGASRNGLLYVGKYSRAKGLPWLLDAFEKVKRDASALQLHIAGGGSGREAEDLERRMLRMDGVVVHGGLSQPELADLMRRSQVCVLPSFYEGLPLVLVEAAACGCRLVATRLEGIESELAGHLAPVLELVEPPRIEGPDSPIEEDLPTFTDRLVEAMNQSLESAAKEGGTVLPPDALAPFTWAATFRRVEKIWCEVLDGHAGE